MPVCARCAGLYAGAGLAAVILLIRGGSRAIGSDAMRRALAMAALPTLATLLVESVTGATPANWIRAGAGVPLGAAVAWAIGSVTHVK
jgi:uncharacterized membrane protein